MEGGGGGLGGGGVAGGGGGVGARGGGLEGEAAEGVVGFVALELEGGDGEGVDHLADAAYLLAELVGHGRALGLVVLELGEAECGAGGVGRNGKDRG